MKIILAKMLKTIIGALITEKMIIWGLEFSAKQTKNKVDDNLVLIAKSAYKSDIEGIQEGIKKLTEELTKKD